MSMDDKVRKAPLGGKKSVLGSIASMLFHVLSLGLPSSFSFSPSVTSSRSGAGTSTTWLASSSSTFPDHSAISRREAFFRAAAAGASSAALFVPLRPSSASTASTAEAMGGNLNDLPPEATRSYLQYRVPFVISSDFYIFELQEKLESTDDWGEIGQLFQANGGRGASLPSRIEREFVNPMRILGLSMPPDTAEKMQDSQAIFERGMFKLGQATKGIRRDIPIVIDAAQIKLANDGWEEGRKGLNGFIVALNEATGLDDVQTLPPRGPNQFQEYGRSKRRYNELVKKTKLCQNRGGPTLAQAWGGLMVTGYLQDSCGIPDLELYFNQK